MPASRSSVRSHRHVIIEVRSPMSQLSQTLHPAASLPYDPEARCRPLLSERFTARNLCPIRSPSFHNRSYRSAPAAA